jgi:hypothetical protein
MSSFGPSMSDTTPNVACMLDEYEMPRPEEVGALDDFELVDAMAAATLMETAAVEVRLAAMQEMYERQMRAPAPARPTPPRPAQGRSRGRARRNRKRKRRR